MKTKRILFILLLLCASLALLASCGEEQKNHYTVTFNSNGGEQYQTRAVSEGDKLAEPQVPTRTGYTFLGWYNGEVEWNFATDTVNDDMTLTAKWQRITYIVRFDSDGGSAVAEQVVESGNYITEPQTPTKKDCRFLGWYNGGEQWYFATNRVNDHITLTAKWESYPTYTVTFDSNGGTSVEAQYVVEGYTATLPTLEPTKASSKFAGWYVGSEPWDFGTPITGNITVTAKWEDIPVVTFTLTFNSGDAAAVEPQNVVEGEKASEPPQPAREQLSKFLGWYDGDVKWDFNTPVTANVTLTAKWLNIYKISFDTDGAGNIEAIYVNEGDKIVLQASNPSKADYDFVAWHYNGTAWDFSKAPASDMTLKAVWQAVPTFTVTFDTAGGSAVSEENVKTGGTVKEPANPTKTGYRFDGWYNGSKLWSFNSDTVTKDITLTAKWIETVTVTYSMDGITVNTVTIDKGTTLANTEADPEKGGYVFRGWKLGDTVWNFDDAVNSSIVLTPYWKEAVTVTFDSNGGSYVEPIVIGKGETIPAPEAPYRGTAYTFLGWCLVNGAKETWSFENDVVTENITLYAKWTLSLPIDEFD